MKIQSAFVFAELMKAIVKIKKLQALMCDDDAKAVEIVEVQFASVR
jgi:hypothetical protein